MKILKKGFIKDVLAFENSSSAEDKYSVGT